LLSAAMTAVAMVTPGKPRSAAKLPVVPGPLSDPRHTINLIGSPAWAVGAVSLPLRLNPASPEAQVSATDEDVRCSVKLVVPILMVNVLMSDHNVEAAPAYPATESKLYFPTAHPATGTFVSVHLVLAVVMAREFVVPIEPVGGAHLYFTLVDVAVDVDADPNDPLAEIPGVANVSDPELTLQVMAKAVAPAEPPCATVVTAVAPNGIATAEAIKSIVRSIELLLPLFTRTSAGLASGDRSPPAFP
jgi:hypothetical protein